MKNAIISPAEQRDRIEDIDTPFYIVYQERILRNMKKLHDVATRANIKIIMAFKANALWKTFPDINKFFSATTASSLNEMRLSLDYFGNDVHTYCPVYTDATFPQFLEGSSHITFNSLAQFHKYYPQILKYNKLNPSSYVSAGLRVNPHCSVIETDIYNPCQPGSRFGESSATLQNGLPAGLEGLHFHALCESSSYDLEKVFEAFEAEYGHLLKDAKWLNMGGGHLITRADYDTEHLIKLLNSIHDKYPHLELIIEPGSAFTWQTGDLVTTVLDVVEDTGIKTAIIDASFACHMPDCLEMPYKPAIAEALPDTEDQLDGSTESKSVTPGKKENIDESANKEYEYRLGGNSCLSGDFVGTWKFSRPLKLGDRLTLLDMNHYTTVKTNMFNGIQHPSIWYKPAGTDTPFKLLRRFTYNDYRTRMD